MPCRIGLTAMLCVALAQNAGAAELADIAFLAGHWNVAAGRVPLFGARPNGACDVVRQADGSYVIREDIAIFGVEGQLLAKNVSTTTIFGGDGTLHADFADRKSVV